MKCILTGTSEFNTFAPCYLSDYKVLHIQTEHVPLTDSQKFQGSVMNIFSKSFVLKRTNFIMRQNLTD